MTIEWRIIVNHARVGSTELPLTALTFSIIMFDRDV